MLMLTNLFVSMCDCVHAITGHVINLATTDVERFLLVGIFWPYLWEVSTYIHQHDANSTTRNINSLLTMPAALLLCVHST
jgi:hypothetical protein